MQKIKNKQEEKMLRVGKQIEPNSLASLTKISRTQNNLLLKIEGAGCSFYSYIILRRF